MYPQYNAETLHQNTVIDGTNEIIYLSTRLYGVGHMDKDHSESDLVRAQPSTGSWGLILNSNFVS